MVEATMYALGGLLLRDGFLGDWTLGTGDGAEELTSGVATKGEESPLLIRAIQEEPYPKAVFEDQVDHCSTKPLTSDRARPENIVKPSD